MPGYDSYDSWSSMPSYDAPCSLKKTVMKLRPQVRGPIDVG